ncbi:MAG: metal-sensitive transcriptional regulator [Candidatus Nanopelagicales bacterium]|jgi:DNA-binding FrmR family transcriptional regulator
MAAKKAKASHVLTDEEQVVQISNRLKRAHGQLGAVLRMIEEGRNCDEIITQMSAVSKAINTAAFTLLTSSMKECLTEKRKDSEEVSENLQKLFLSLA